MKKTITVVLIARTGSTRCPRKVIKTFANDMSLFEMMCIKLKECEFPIAAGIGDSELIDIASQHQIPIFRRMKKAVTTAKTLIEIHKYLDQCQTSHVMLISPCTPFLTVETINQVCRDFCESKTWESFSSVTKEQNWFFNEDRKPLVPIDVQKMSSNDLCVYALANTFEVFPVDRFLREGIYYTFQDPNDPYLYEIPKKEAFDIDGEEDFELGQYMWQFREKRSVCRDL